MKTLEIAVEDDLMEGLDKLPESERNLFYQWLKGYVFPTGGDQIVLAYEMHEKGLPLSLISLISRLDKDFLKDALPAVKNG